MNELPKIHVCLMAPEGYAHADALLDPALYVQHQLSRFGGEVSFGRNQLRAGAVNLVFGAHNGFDPRLRQAYSCIFVNLEQIGAGGANLPPAYLQLLRSSAVVDYDAANPQAYTQHPQDVPLVSFGHAPYLQPEAPLAWADRPIDVLFFGSLNERRVARIRRIEQAGRKVTVAPVPCYGAQRDALLRQAKVVVNLPFYDSARFEQVRAFMCLSSGTALMSERVPQLVAPEGFEHSVCWFTDAQLETAFGPAFDTAAFQDDVQQRLARFQDVDPIGAYADVAAFAAGIWRVHSESIIGQTEADAQLHNGHATQPLPSAVPRKRALVLSNHLHDFGGSEILSLEVAETLLGMGYDVHVHTNALAPGMHQHTDPRIRLSDGAEAPNLFDYDFVWAQHHLLPMCLNGRAWPAQPRTRLVSVHLSPYEPFEHTGLNMAQALGATFVANSAETQAQLQAMLGPEAQVLNLYNACPDAFWGDVTATDKRLRSVLLVSNHLPQEVVEAFDQPELQDVRVSRVGFGGEILRITPEILQGFDAIVSIGKTVQYALKVGKPVYCYDRFGGPGWLTPDNMSRAEAFNFAGRCCRTQRDAQALARDLRDGYAAALEALPQLRSDYAAKYSLNDFLSRQTQGAALLPGAAAAERAGLPQQVKRELAASKVIRDLYRRTRG
jgi:hypothetical protein